MKKTYKTAGCILASALAIGLSPAALADIKWTFTPGAIGVADGAIVSSSLQVGGVGGSTKVQVSSWADTGAGANGSRKLYQGNTFAWGGGLGVQWKAPTDYGIGTIEWNNNPQHSMDNCGPNPNGVGTCGTEGTPDTDQLYPEEFILFSFNSGVDPDGGGPLPVPATSVKLQEVGVGWWSYDSDISVLAYTGSGVPDLTLRTYGDLTANGWSFVGHYANVGDCDTWEAGCSPTQTDAIQINTQGISSSYWLVGAYNSRVGSPTDLTNDNDFIKLVSLKGVDYTPPPPPSVPTPGPLALIALAGLVFPARKRWLPRR